MGGSYRDIQLFLVLLDTLISWFAHQLVFEAEQSYSRYRLMGLRESYAYRKDLCVSTGEQAILRVVMEGVDCAHFLLTSY